MSNYLKQAIGLVLFICATATWGQQINLDAFKDSTYWKPVAIKVLSQPKNGLKLSTKKFRVPNDQLASTKIRTVFPVPTFWEKKNHFGLTISEVAFVNWNAGGNNSVSALGNVQLVRNYKSKKSQWNNELIFKYGINSQEGEKLRKTDDQIHFSSTYGYRKDTLSNWFFSVKTNFKTQFSDGFKYPDRENPISRFMAPGYFFLGLGAEYSPLAGIFSVYLSPLTQKTTFVLDQTLANQGAFGVKKAVFDDDGNIIEKGEKHRTELGILVNSNWEQEIAKNITLRNRISLYTDYLNSFGNIDVDWEVNFDFVVNNSIKANLGAHTKFDDDVRFDEVKNEDGEVISSTTKIQFKQVLGIGIAYTF